MYVYVYIYMYISICVYIYTQSCVKPIVYSFTPLLLNITIANC